MRIVVIGASGTIGSHTVRALQGHDIVTAGRNSGDVRVDRRDPESVKKMYESVGPVDAVLCIGGESPFRKIPEVTPEDVDNVVESLRGSIQIVLSGAAHINPKGSIIFTTGSTILDPIPISGVSCALGGALNTLVRGASLSMPNDIRINCMIPPLVAETAKVQGIEGNWISSTEVAQWYVEALEGDYNGQWRTTEGWTDFATGKLGWDVDTFEHKKT